MIPRSLVRYLMLGAIQVLAIAAFAVPPAKQEALKSNNALRLLTPGINLGNTLEAIPKETSWGNPEPTKAYFQGIRRAGFRSVRIPAAWTQYSDKNHTIDRKWMKHVTDVVQMALDADLFVVLNVHWDGGWLQPTPERKVAATQKLRRFWTQIATNFRSFDDRLLFAGTNEVGVEGQYSMPAPQNAAIQNGFNQAFVDTVRATGGPNRNRILVVQGYNTDIDAAMKYNRKLPKDSAKGRLMMELHYYSPYNFVLNEKSDVWQWGKDAEDPSKADTWGNEDYVDAQFKKLQTAFVAKGIPVLLGEFSCGMKPRFPGMNKYRIKWDEYVTESAVRHGLVPMLWDTGGAFDRTTGAIKDKELIRRLIPAAHLGKRP